MDLGINDSEVEEETSEELVLPGGDDGVETDTVVKAHNLNSKSYAGEEKVIVTLGLFGKTFLPLIEMKQHKEAIAEKEAETSSDDIKPCYQVHSVRDSMKH